MKTVTLMAIVCFSAGCTFFAPAVSSAVPNDSGTKLIQANYNAVDQLLAAIPSSKSLNKNQPMIIATLVNIDDLKGSRLGRMLSEQISTKLTKSGYTMVELKLRGNVFVKQAEGEYLLSREIKDITVSHKAQAVVVGTYSVSYGYVYVNIKIVGAVDNQVISAHDYILPLDSNVRSLVWPVDKN